MDSGFIKKKELFQMKNAVFNKYQKRETFKPEN